MERKALHEMLTSFDVAIVPLKTRIFGSVPSKIFEYGSLGFPILYFGGGEGETIVKESHLGWVATVGNFKDLNYVLHQIATLNKESIDIMKKRIFIETQIAFNLDQQMKELIINKVF